jgi:hypothetical protein
MPIWGEKVDREVQRYIKGIQDVALANAHWRYGYNNGLRGSHIANFSNVIAFALLDISERTESEFE